MNTLVQEAAVEICSFLDALGIDRLTQTSERQDPGLLYCLRDQEIVKPCHGKVRWSHDEHYPVKGFRVPIRELKIQVWLSLWHSGSIDLGSFKRVALGLL